MTGDPTGSTHWTVDRSGGRLALDFVNTVGGMRGVRPREHLLAYPDLVEFARQTGGLDERAARRLLSEAHRRPADAEAVLAEAKALREALYRIFLACSRGEAPTGEDVERLSRALGGALAHRRLQRRGGAYALGWEDAPALDAPLWPTIAAAGELLSSPGDVARVRVCGMFDDEECSWLFVDESRAGTRRWCSMQDCGNRAKARRHQRRLKARP